jgi:hypothetical protein
LQKQPGDLNYRAVYWRVLNQMSYNDMYGLLNPDLGLILAYSFGVFVDCMNRSSSLCGASNVTL